MIDAAPSAHWVEAALWQSQEMQSMGAPPCAALYEAADERPPTPTWSKDRQEGPVSPDLTAQTGSGYSDDAPPAVEPLDKPYLQSQSTKNRDCAVIQPVCAFLVSFAEATHRVGAVMHPGEVREVSAHDASAMLDPSLPATA